MSGPALLLKVLTTDGRSCHGGDLQWPLPTPNPDGTWTPGEAVAVKGKLVPCENGIHLATPRQVIEHWLGARVWVAQWGAEIVDAGDKYVVRTARLLHPTEWDDRIARHFACDCAERVLHLTTDPRPKDAIRIARLFAEGWATDEERAAAGAAAEDAAWDAARAAAWAAAGAAAGNAARAAAGAAAGDAAADAARAAAWAAAGAAAGNAAGNAALDWQTERFLYYLKGGQPEVIP